MMIFLIVIGVVCSVIYFISSLLVKDLNKNLKVFGTLSHNFTATLFILYLNFPVFLEKSIIPELIVLFISILLIIIIKHSSKGGDDKKSSSETGSSLNSVLVSMLILTILSRLFLDNTLENYIVKWRSYNQTTISKDSKSFRYTKVFVLSDERSQICKYTPPIRFFLPEGGVTIIEYDSALRHKKTTHFENDEALDDFEFDSNTLAFKGKKGQRITIQYNKKTTCY